LALIHPRVQSGKLLDDKNGAHIPQDLILVSGGDIAPISRQLQWEPILFAPEKGLHSAEDRPPQEQLWIIIFRRSTSVFVKPPKDSGQPQRVSGKNTRNVPA